MYSVLCTGKSYLSCASMGFSCCSRSHSRCYYHCYHQGCTAGITHRIIGLVAWFLIDTIVICDIYLYILYIYIYLNSHCECCAASLPALADRWRVWHVAHTHTLIRIRVLATRCYFYFSSISIITFVAIQNDVTKPMQGVPIHTL